MNATKTPAPKFRYLGCTDDVVVCEKCGKEELKKTIVLAVLDADGNVEETTYYGSSCAARALTALTGRKHTAAAVRRDAENALYRLQADARSAQGLLDYYGPYEHDEAALIDAYRHAHGDAYNVSYGEWLDRARSMFVTRRAQVEAYQRVLHPAA